MLILRRLSDGFVERAFDDTERVLLGAAGLSSPFVSDKYTADTHEVLSVEAPLSWAPRALAYNAGVWTVVDTDAYDAAPATKDELKDYAAAKRWAFETGGTMVGPMKVSTDSTSQAKINAAHTGFTNGTITGTIAFKAETGWVDVDASTMAVVYAAVVAHVQSGYAREKQAVDAIEAETVTKRSEVDAIFA